MQGDEPGIQPGISKRIDDTTSPFYKTVIFKVTDESVMGAQPGDRLGVFVDCHGRFLEEVVLQRTMDRASTWFLVDKVVAEESLLPGESLTVIDNPNRHEVLVRRTIQLTIASLLELVANGSLRHEQTQRSSVGLEW